MKWGLTVLCFFILTTCFFIIRMGQSESDPLYWPDWYILLLPQTLEAADAEELLVSAGIQGSLSAASAEVSYMAIPELKQVAIANLDSVLVPGDPRRDSYLTRVSEIFKSDDADLVYLPAARSLADYHRTIRRIPEMSSATLMDDLTSRNWFPVLIFIGISLVYAAAASSRGPVFMRVPSIFPLAVLIYVTLPSAVFPALLVFILSPSIILLKSERRSAWFAPAVGAGFAAAAVCLVLTVGTEYLMSVSAALISAELAACVTVMTFRKIRPGRIGISRRPHLKRRDHRLFEPVSLAGSPHPVPPGRRYPEFLAIAAVLMTILIPLRVAPDHPPIPYAAPADGGFSSFSMISRLSENQTVENLPDISGLVSSLVFQEGFLYGSSYRLPFPGELLTVRDYSDRGSSITASESVITDYDESWFESLVSRELNRGAGRLYKSLGGPSPIIRVTHVPTGDTGALRNVQIILFGIAVLVMLMLPVYPASGKRPIRGGKYTPILTARRRAQAA